jgi:hypothetical protein
MLADLTTKKHFFYDKIINLFYNLRIYRYSVADKTKTNVYYEYNLDQSFTPDYYINFLNLTTGLKAVITQVSIQPNILDLDTAEIIKRHGKPGFVFKENDITVFIYKWDFNGLKNRCKVHFYKNKAFLVNHDYPSISADDKQFLKNTFLQKYLKNEGQAIDVLKCKIADGSGNIAFFNQVLLGLHVSYLSNTASAWFTGMTYDIEQKKNLQHKKEELTRRKFHSIL